MFNCLYDGAENYGWVINGTLLPLPLPLGFDSEDPLLESPTATLTIQATPQRNNITVQCRAIVEEGGVPRFEFSDAVTLQVQGEWYLIFRIAIQSTIIPTGPLESVPSLYFNETFSSGTTITISWSAPFSLNLTTAEPDIQYCVDVYNVTGGGNHHLDSVCGITDTQYTYTAPDPTGVYNFTVTPRSNIEGSLNGTTSQPVEGYTTQCKITTCPWRKVE